MLLLLLSTSGGIFYFSRKSEEESDTTEDENTYDDLLCRFVLDGTGKTVGETISIAGDIIIIKSGKQYIGVPLKHIEDKGKTLLVKGLVDYDKARELGEHWRATSWRELEQQEDSKGK